MHESRSLGAEVTLTGTLRSRNAKRRTPDVVEQVSGVKDVHNLIRVSDEQVRQMRGIP